MTVETKAEKKVAKHKFTFYLHFFVTATKIYLNQILDTYSESHKKQLKYILHVFDKRKKKETL